MPERKYYVTCDNRTVAENCDLKTALLVCKGYFEEYYNEHDMVIAVAEMERTQGELCK